MKPFRLAATGETLCTQRVSCHQNEKFLSLVELFRGADVAFTNLETRIHTFKGYPMPVETMGISQSYQQADPFVAEELKWMGFDLLARSNNHGMDFGPEMIFEETEIIENAGFVHAGAGRNLSEATRPAYLETANGRAALISVCTDFPPHCPAGQQRHDMHGRPGINPLRHDVKYILDKDAFENLKQMCVQLGEDKKIRDKKIFFSKSVFELGEKTETLYTVRKSDLDRNIRAIKDARRAADYVLVHIHQSAKEKNGGPPKRVQELVRKFIDAGADVIIGDGPHMLQGIEIYNGKPIFYSLSNFVYQSETIKRFPYDIYERNGLDDTATPQDVLDYRDKVRSGKILRDGYVPTRSGDSYMRWFDALVGYCTFDKHDLEEIKLYPVHTYHADRPQRGLPKLANETEGKRIIEYMADCSSVLGTKIEYKDGIGRVIL